MSSNRVKVDTGHVNLGKLLSFADSLKKLSAAIDDHSKAIDHSIKRLGESHKDLKYRELQEKFKADKANLNEIGLDIAKYSKHIKTVWKSDIESFLKTS